MMRKGRKYISRLLKNAHLRRSPCPSSLQRTSKYASLLRISGALHVDIFDQPYKQLLFFSKLLGRLGDRVLSDEESYQEDVRWDTRICWLRKKTGLR
jgi:hypothetical protein